MLISSHLLGEIEQMVDQVGILNHGKLLFEGSLQQLQKHSRGGILLRVLDAPKAAAVLQPVSYTHLDVYKRQSTKSRKSSGK